MSGLSDEEVKERRYEVIDRLQKLYPGSEFIDSFIESSSEYDIEENGCVPLKYLAISLKHMADADLVYFVNGWQKARGCIIEHICAELYSLKIFEE